MKSSRWWYRRVLYSCSLNILITIKLPKYRCNKELIDPNLFICQTLQKYENFQSGNNYFREKKNRVMKKFIHDFINFFFQFYFFQIEILCSLHNFDNELNLISRFSISITYILRLSVTMKLPIFFFWSVTYKKIDSFHVRYKLYQFTVWLWNSLLYLYFVGSLGRFT